MLKSQVSCRESTINKNPLFTKHKKPVKVTPDREESPLTIPTNQNMKLNKIALLALTAVGFLVNSQSVSADIVIENMGVCSLPREDASNSAYEGGTWDAASSNWMDLIKNRGAVGDSVGSGQEIAERQADLDDYTGMITTAPGFESWKAVAGDNSPDQWGNRIHNGIWVYVDENDETFVPADVEVTFKSQVWSQGSQSWSYDGVVNQMTTLATTNDFRLRLNAGTDSVPGTSDDLVDIQNGNLDTVSFLYGGIGIGVGSFGSGSDQQKIQNTLNYLRSGHFRIEVRVTVPFDKNGSPQEPASALWYIMQSECEVDLDTLVISDPNTLEVMTNVGALYQIEKSEDLSDWKVDGHLSGSGEIDYDIFEYPSTPRQFYRVRCFGYEAPLAPPILTLMAETAEVEGEDLGKLVSDATAVE